MKTLNELIIEQRCRKGAAAGTTKRGAFWVAGTVRIRAYGGDGVGQNSSDMHNILELRHYRSGEVRAVVRIESWHQNTGDQTSYHDVSELINCHTVEDVIVALKGDDGSDFGSLYSDSHKERLTKFLAGMGMPESLPAPDETPA